MKYIGPFLRINTLKKENIQNQLFYFSKESLKHIVLKSKCGITIPIKELKIKNIPNFDINTFKSISPLLCVYKKSTPKLIKSKNKLYWDKDKFKKNINIFGNCLMTLCLLEMIPYYKNFKNIDSNNYSLSYLYLKLCKKQLEFYTSYLRNIEGVFIDKKNVTDVMSNKLKLTEKNKKFKFSNQALLMTAFYKYSSYNEDKNNNFNNFSLDILNMLLQFKEELYSLSFNELLKLCLALNIFYEYSKNEKAKLLLLNLSELLIEKYNNDCYINSSKKIQYICMTYINCILFYKNTKLSKFYDISNNIIDKLIKLYNPEAGIFIKDPKSEKEINFSSTEIMLYLISLFINSDINKDNDKNDLIITDIYKNLVINSGIILSWPDAPNLNNKERYRNFSLNSEDLIEEKNFRMISIPTPENCELAPVFTKKVKYNTKKHTFKQSKLSFYSDINFFMLFLIIYLFNKKDNIETKNTSL